MIIYLETREVFLEHVQHNRIEVEVGERYRLITGRRVSPSEVNAWRNSLLYVGNLLRSPGIPTELGVAIEYQIHNTSRRIDLLLSGRSAEDRDAAVIVELKQWEMVEATEMDGVVRSVVGGGPRELTHPSYQAWSYSCLLEDFNTTVQEHGIEVTPCAYLHNCNDGSGVLADCYRHYLKQAPVFLRHDTEAMVAFLTSCLKQGDRGETIERIRDGRARPSRQLADCFEQMVLGNSEFTLIEEQKVVYERALQLARRLRRGKRTVLLVRGGPGTGKSVVAIHLMAALLQKSLNVRYVSKNAAPRTVFKAKLTGQLRRTRFDNLFCGSGAFVDCPPGHYDVLVVDEAHRLNQFSGLYGNQGENQVKEIINASHLSVFFLDEDQQVTWKDIGTEAEIRLHAGQLGAELVTDELPSQFRCAGSDGYLAWLDDLLGIRTTANPELDLEVFDFRLFDDPVSLHAAIRKANSNNRARLVAGYCWNWVSRRDPGLNDIVIPEHGYAAQWNLAAEGNTWIISPTGVEEVGCVHTCQGLEVDTIGVIIGPDLVFRDGQLLVNPAARARSDKSLSGWRAALATDSEGTEERVSRLIRNTYRTLMSRGMKSCWVFACDPVLQGYLRERLAPPATWPT
jgi:DUF2075 family protein